MTHASVAGPPERPDWSTATVLSVLAFDVLAGSTWMWLPVSSGRVVNLGGAALALASLVLYWYLLCGRTGKPIRSVFPRGTAPVRSLCGWAALGIAVDIAAFVLNSVAVELVYRLVFGQATPEAEAPIERSGSFADLVALLDLAVLGPLVEEVVFRGVLYRWLALRTRESVAVGVSAGLFAVLHLEWERLPYLFVSGVLFAFLVRRSGSIYPSLVVHAVANGVVAFAVVLVWLLT